jgi:hypothetical protein
MDKKGFEIGEWISRQHGTRSKYQQTPEQSSRHNSSFEHNSPNTITVTDMDMKTGCEDGTGASKNRRAKRSPTQLKTKNH